jgi:hypothetical protein
MAIFSIPDMFGRFLKNKFFSRQKRAPAEQLGFVRALLASYWELSIAAGGQGLFSPVLLGAASLRRGRPV